MDDQTKEAGAARRARAQGARHADLHANLGSIDPRLPQWADGFIFGHVWESDALEFDDRQMVAIIALAATGKGNQLRNYLHGALQAGIDPRRIHESLMMLPIYAGFPTAIESLGVWREVVQSSRRRGLDVDVPVAPDA